MFVLNGSSIFVVNDCRDPLLDRRIQPEAEESHPCPTYFRARKVAGWSAVIGSQLSEDDRASVRIPCVFLRECAAIKPCTISVLFT